MQPDFFKTTKVYYPKMMMHFDMLITQNRLSHLYLFIGPSQPIKLAFSRYLAWQVIGPTERNAIRINENDHPDVKITQPSLPKSGLKNNRTWKVDQIRALKPEFITVARESNKKVFVFDSVETLKSEAGNALLKFIEEPFGPQLIMMFAENVNEVLPTIRSRAQIVHLQPESDVTIDIDSDDKAYKEWSDNALTVLFKWFELTLQRQIQAFVYVQEKLIDNLQDDQQQTIFLNWLHQLTRDMIMFSQVPESQLYFPKLVGLYKTLDKIYSREKLVAVSDAIFKDDFLKNYNLSLQTRLEKIVLDVANVLGE